MKEEKKLMNLNLENENQKLETIQITGLKRCFYNLVHYLLEKQDDNIFLDYLLIVGQFIQLMSFPLDYIFASGWKNIWFETVTHFFHYFQTIFIFTDYSHFYIISFFITLLYIIIFVFLLILSMHKLEKNYKISKTLSEILYIFIQLNTILCLPFFKILFNIFILCNDDNNNNIFNEDIECEGKIHIAMIIISCIFIVIYFPLLLLFKSIYYQFGIFSNKLKSCYTSSTEVLLLIIKLILIIAYKFLKHKIALSIISLILSFFVCINYFNKQPFINRNLNKIYLIFYLLFLWTNTICFISLILKNSKFEGAVLLLLLGYPFIILLIITKEYEFTLEKIFEFDEDKYKNGYKNLLKIVYFLKLEESLYDKIRTREHKILYAYIDNYEKTCANENCSLKKFTTIPLKVENFYELKLLLLLHAEILFKIAISKYPFNAKLRLSYAIFLYDKMNKKQQGTSEILLLSKYPKNFEDSFLIFRGQKIIEYKNSVFNFNLKQNNNDSMSYKSILNKMKTIMGKLAMNYIDFWSILAKSEKLNNENLRKINDIGNKINNLNANLNNNIEKIERFNLHDLETAKLYSQYLIEVLNDQTCANKYKSKIVELEHMKHQYDEDNIFNLNYKEMSHSEEYNYLVIDCSTVENFGLICNMSLSSCLLFGFTKEELIRRPLDYILPELYIEPHKKLLEEKTVNFKNKIFSHNTNGKIHSDFKILETFARNKMKYIVPIKIKNALVSTEEGKIYGVSKIITENYLINDQSQEIAYVLTDEKFIINSFTPNSSKLLNLQLSISDLNLDITQYIQEMRKDLYLYEENTNYEKGKKNTEEFKDKRKLSKKTTLATKTSLIKNSYILEKDKKKKITWNLYDLYGKAPEPKRLSRNIRSDLREDFQNYNKQDEEELNNTSSSDENNNLKSSKTLTLRKNVQENSKNENSNEEKYNSFLSQKKNENERGKELDSVNFKKINKNFLLTIKEIKLGDKKVGFIFKFESTNKINNNSKNFSYSIINYIISKKLKTNSDTEKSDISEMSFAYHKKAEPKKIIFNKTEENKNGVDLGLDITFIPKLDKENEFYLDVERMSYKQINVYDKNKNYKLSHKILREQAEQKIMKLKEKEINEKEEESEESSSDSENEEDIENSIKSSSLFSNNEKNEDERKSKLENQIQDNLKNIEQNNKDNKRNSIKPILKTGKTINQQTIIKPGNNNDYYKVNPDHITLFVYNYSTGFVEAIKDPKFKISQMVSQMQINKERIGKSNSKLIANPKLAHKERKKNLINSLKKSNTSENEISSTSEKKIKLIEIEKELKSKEKQSSIINLCIFSFVVLLLVLGSSFASILFNILVKKRIFNYNYLLEKSIILYRDLLYEIFFVREIVSIPNENYLNIYQNDKEKYFLNYTSTCEDYYLETSSILSDLSTAINKLSGSKKDKLMNKKGELIIIEKGNSLTKNNLNFKIYELLIYSAFHEINAALYHISQMKMEEVNEYNENIFYFMGNSLNFMLSTVDEQINIIIDEFNNQINMEKYYLLICVGVIIIVYIICYLIFVYFYTKVENVKEKYLSIFEDIGKEYIFDSLKKCENFSQIIHLKEESNINQNENITKYSSIKNEDEEKLENNESILKKIKEVKQINSSGRTNLKKTLSHTKQKIAGFIIFLIFLLVQLYTYLYYFLRFNLYKNCIQYEYYNIQYNSLFLIPFLAMREYLGLNNNTLMGQKMTDYLDNILTNYYMQLNEISEKRNKFSEFLPDVYINYLKDLYDNKQCNFLDDFLSKYSNDNYSKCSDFFYNMSYYGFDAITMSFFEDLRNMYNLAVERHKNDISNAIIYFTLIMKNEKYKMNIIIYRFIIMKVIEQSIDKLFEAVSINFDETQKISLIINIIFMAVFIVGFVIFWFPFVLEENETIYKAKNMLSIIPKDILLDLPNINVLGLEGES